MIKGRKTRLPLSFFRYGFGRSRRSCAPADFAKKDIFSKWEAAEDPEGERKNKRKNRGGGNVASSPPLKIIDVGKVDGDSLSSPPASSLSSLATRSARSLFNLFFISSGLDYFLISPNVSSISRLVLDGCQDNFGARRAVSRWIINAILTLLSSSM